MSAVQRDPDELARDCAAGASMLLALDVDGVLAPIAERADQARLLDGVEPVITALRRVVPVAVVSGRSLADLEERFGFPDGIEVVGSHGLERRGHAPLALSDDERELLDRLVEVAARGRDLAGRGAWLEHKPASVVLHVREADAEAGRLAIDQVVAAARGVARDVKPGHMVVELLARRTSKATAIADLRHECGVARVVYAGDDHTDEEVFASLGDDDLSVRVGPGDTLARVRLDDPAAVLAWLEALRDLLV